MKRALVGTFPLLFTLAIATTLTGCVPKQASKEQSISLVTLTAPVEFSFPPGWEKNPKEHPYDLQCLAKSGEMNSGVFVYRRADIALSSTPADILQDQIQDFRSKRANFVEFEPLVTYEDDHKRMSTVTYVGEKDNTRNCYRFTLIEFKADESKFAIVMQVAKPGAWERCKPVLDGIVRTAKPLPEMP